MVLDAFQAGLSWRTVLHKREAFRLVFYGFDPRKVAAMPPAVQAMALGNTAIIRNRLKIQAAVENARAFLALQQRHGSFDAFIWSFSDGRTIHNHRKSMEQIPACSDLSNRISKALKAEGFSFVGKTICYSPLQAAGVINDHLVNCVRYVDLSGPPGRSARS